MDKPLILDYALNRVNEGEKLFKYDYKQDMNVLVNNTSQVFINEESSVTLGETKPQVKSKSHNINTNKLELLTKTEIEREADDDEYFFLELETKTFIDRERDDTDDTPLN